MNTKTITVPNISCGHCTAAIEEEVAEIAGVTSVKAEIDTKIVTINYDAPASWQQINDLLVAINYAPAE